MKTRKRKDGQIWAINRAMQAGSASAWKKKCLFKVTLGEKVCANAYTAITQTEKTREITQAWYGLEYWRCSISVIICEKKKNIQYF